MPGFNTVGEPPGSEAYEVIPVVDGFGNPANGSGFWGCAVFTVGNEGVQLVGHVEAVLPSMSTDPLVIVNREQLVCWLTAAVELVEFTRMPPPVRWMSAWLSA